MSASEKLLRSWGHTDATLAALRRDAGRCGACDGCGHIETDQLVPVHLRTGYEDYVTETCGACNGTGERQPETREAV